jgi:hypothetical protein
MKPGIRTVGGSLMLAVALTLAGCTGTPEPMPVPTTEPEPTRTPGAITTEPELRPGQNAAANQQYFDLVNDTFGQANGMGTSRGIVDNLVAAGFEKADIEVTPDSTAINIAVDSIVVSVRIKGECLVGQFSPNQYSSVVAPLLGTGRCLVGETLPIDW